jgi:hypothetical protein
MPIPTKSVDDWMKTLILKGLDGTLSQRDFNQFLSEWKSVKTSATWMKYRKEVSWTPYTTEYLDSLANLLDGNRVLHVYARNGILAAHMQKRGVQWLPIQKPQEEEPYNPKGACPVAPIPISEALRMYTPTVIFGDWLPRGKTYDYDLTVHGLPMVLITEDYGGKCGSSQLWEHGADRTTGVAPDVGYSIVSLESIGGFTEAPNWHGNNAKTVMVLPRGSALITPNKAAFAGPPVRQVG